MKRARIQVTLELLAQALYLPHGMTIEGIRTDASMWMPNTCEMVLCGEELPVPEIRPGEQIPQLEAICIRETDEHSLMPRIIVKFRPKDT